LHGSRSSAFAAVLGCLLATWDCSTFSSFSECMLQSVAILHRALCISEELLQAMRSSFPAIPEERLRTITLAFVNRSLLLEATVYPISAERLGNHPILFSDSIEKLNEQLALVDEVLGHYNRLARQAHFAELTRDSIRLGSGVQPQNKKRKPW
jgi:hypothetical protein